MTALARAGILRLSAAIALASWFTAAEPAGQRPAPRELPPESSAALTGVVVDFETGRPVRRAIVSLRGGSVGERSIVADDAGRFAFEGLAPARYTLVANKAAYIESQYGARRPGRPGSAIQLEAGRAADVVLRIARGAVLEGTIRDSTGAPLEHVIVSATDGRELQTNVAAPWGATSARAITDDRGRYRLFGLPPGEYVIVAAGVNTREVSRRPALDTSALIQRLQASRTGRPASAGPAASPEQVFATPDSTDTVVHLHTYYPGVPTVSLASRIRVEAGEARIALDFALVPVRAAVIEGVIARADGAVLRNPRVSIASESSMQKPQLDLAPGEDGRFRFINVAPGRYVLTATGEAAADEAATSRAPAAAHEAADLPWLATAEVEIRDGDPGIVTMVLRPGATVSGRIAFAGTPGHAPPDPSDVRLTLRPAGSEDDFRPTFASGNAGIVGRTSVRLDGSFSIEGVAPGAYRLNGLRPQAGDDGWHLESVTLGGRDLLERPLVVSTEAIGPIVITYSDRRTELAGSIQTPAGRPAPEHTIVVVPADPALWRPGSRRMKSARPGSDGQFTIPDLPAGAYLIAALSDFDPSDFEDPAFLEQLAVQGVAVTVRAGERTVQDLRIVE